MEKRLTLTLRQPVQLTRVEMASWILDHPIPNQHEKLSAQKALGVVDALKSGTPLLVTMLYSQDSAYETCPFLDCKSEVIENEYERGYRERHEEWAVADDLRERGAAGDAEAAIAFCKLNHVRLFAAYAG